MTVSKRQCVYECGTSVESPDGYVSGGVPLAQLGKGRNPGLLTECRHKTVHFKCLDKRLALACFHCYNTKTLLGITVANGYGSN